MNVKSLIGAVYAFWATRKSFCFKVKKYKVVFIGSPGSGKTTIICNWLGLLREDKSYRNSVDDVSLLNAAHGHPSLAEIHIKQNHDSLTKVHIQYLSIEKQNDIIYDYCRYYYGQFFPESAGGNENSTNYAGYMLERFVLNMSGLKRISYGCSAREIEERKKIKLFLESFQCFEEFLNYVITVIDLKKRMCTELYYNPKESLEIWLNRIFNGLNEGKLDNCSFPSVISLEIAKKDLDLGLPENVSEVIDTVCIGSSFRMDMINYLREEDTICFLLDSVAHAPSMENRNLLKSAFSDNKCENDYNLKKTSIFVRASESELVDGMRAEDPEEAMEILNNRIWLLDSQNKVLYDNSNTFFMDPYNSYIYDYKPFIEYDEHGGPLINKETNKRSSVPWVDTMTATEH